jgi:cytochrome b
MQYKRVKVWDLPTRIFHWLLALCVGAALVTGQIGGNAIDWHARIGLIIVGLIAFRLTWGIVGSTYARFSTFLPTPSAIRAYLRGEWRGLGHNPFGALSVLALLAFIALQVGTGLFANDDIAFTGPLFSHISKDLSDRLAGIHGLTSKLLIALIVLHLAAIAFYAHIKKDNLVKPMLTGHKELAAEHEDAEQHAAKGGGPVALVIALIVAVAAVYGASGAWIDTPAAPAAAPPAADW